MDKVSKDNSGFSILEVLIAVVILAIIIVPMLHSFVSSHRMNVKSKQLMRATTLAQNEMEIFEKEKIEDLMDPAKFTYTVTGPEADGSYVFARSSISNDESGASASRFDVVVRLNPERADEDGNEDNTRRYFYTNTKDLLYVNTVGGLDSGSFVQPVKNAKNLNGYDENVYHWFYNNKLPSAVLPSDEESGKAALGNGLARKITVRVYQVTEGAKTNTIVKVIYDYFAPDGVMSNGCQRYTDEEVVFNNEQKKDEEGNPVELQNVFLFFAPRYDAKGIPEKGPVTTYGGRNYKVAEDLIVIENEAALPVNFFVVRQELEITDTGQPSKDKEIEKGKTTKVRLVPMNYQAKIEIHDRQNAEGGLCGAYYTNLNLEEIKEEGTGEKILLSIYDSNTGASLYGGDPGVEYIALGEPVKKSIRSLTGDGAMESKDRIYTMEVEVYTHADAHEDDEKPIVTLTGTKLE